MAMLGTPSFYQVFGRGREPGEGAGENVFAPQPEFNNAPVSYAVCTLIVRRKARMAMLDTPSLSQVFGRGRGLGEGEGL